MTILRIALSLSLIAVFHPSAADTTKTDPLLFEKCSQRSNLLINLNGDMKRLHEEADAYNLRHDLLRAQLNRHENRVQVIHANLKEKPITSPVWDTYDLAFEAYEKAMENMREWNEYGDRLEKKYQMAIDLVVAQQSIIKEECSGTWEPAIINKFCDDTSGRFTEFCKEFESKASDM